MSKTQVLTSPHGARFEKAIDIFRCTFEQHPSGGHMGATTIVHNGMPCTVNVTAHAALTPNHRTMFDFAMALRRGEDQSSVKFNINKYLELCGLSIEDTRNRLAVVKLVEDLQTIHLNLDSPAFKANYVLIISSYYDKESGDITVNFNNDDLNSYFENWGKRYANLTIAMSLRSGDLKSFLTFLQLNGQPIERGGEPNYVRSFESAQIIEYMNWGENGSNKSINSVLGQIKNLLKKAREEVPNFPKYSRKKRFGDNYMWLRDTLSQYQPIKPKKVKKAPKKS